ncbi:MAG TPA: acyl-CoA dehydrogenase family protein [Streptosporangiaceae bacterium]|nr:acyl-CoA dehydrogenase family protein [Streptosporangiaceae bacterium]
MSDFFGFADLLSEPEREIVARVRDFLAAEVEPIANEYWSRAEFPFQLIDGFRKLDTAGLMYDGLAAHRGSRLLSGFLSMEIARADPSVNSFYGVHTGLAMGSINRCGSHEQKQRWLPPMARLEKIGAFGLTEPHGGSDVAGGLETTARRDGGRGSGHWVLNGAKKWIGNGTFADLVIIWARDTDDGKVKGFVVEKGTPGFSATRIEGKVALRTVQNADITLDDCVVDEDHRLQQANSFADTADVLRLTRGGVAWGAVGCMTAAYDLALAYAKEREQFGRPIAAFQLVQDHLATMLGNITASLALVVRLAQLQDAGVNADEHSALAKSFTTLRMRETVGLAREVFGGNGILLENNVARYFADAEALYSYEGTREINQLIVGRAVTGLGAFT